MGAARHTQRAQEHAQRRIARSAPTQEETLAGMDREYAGLVDDYIELKKQRDRLRAALDEWKARAEKAEALVEELKPWAREGGWA